MNKVTATLAVIAALFIATSERFWHEWAAQPVNQKILWLFCTAGFLALVFTRFGGYL